MPRTTPTPDVPISHMVAQVYETLKDKPGDYNVNGIVREILESWGKIDVLKLVKDLTESNDEDGHSYWEIVRMHDMAMPNESDVREVFREE